MQLKPGDKIEFWQAGEWTMVYLNGQLVTHGDHYLADEWLQEYVSVTVVQDDDGGKFAMVDDHTPHRRLADAAAAREAAEDRKARAEKLRAQAREMLAEAERVETGATS